jgi:hypothetical protein
VGLGGQLSVEALDERWRSCWRHGTEFQFYSRRKVIIDEIKRLVAGGREASDVVKFLEECHGSAVLWSSECNCILQGG